LRPAARGGHGRGPAPPRRERPAGGRVPAAGGGGAGVSARRVLAITRRLLEQFHRDRRTLGLLVVAPLVILTLCSFRRGGGGDPPAMGVVTLDQGPFGATVARELVASKAVRASEMDASTAAARLRDGGLAGYTVLPADFSAAAGQGAIRPEIHV